MKTFKYTIAGHAVTIRLDEKQGTIADLLVDDKHPAVDAKEMPVIAAVISLIEYDVAVVHDDEPGIITLAPQSSGWANPSQLMASL